MPAMTIGEDETSLALVPNIPCPYQPQHLMVPPEIRAQALDTPTLTWVAVEIPVTETGVEFGLLSVPLPICPLELNPQHLIALVESKAQVDCPPIDN
jgi:hypothetical protein